MTKHNPTWGLLDFDSPAPPVPFGDETTEEVALAYVETMGLDPERYSVVQIDLLPEEQDEEEL